MQDGMGSTPAERLLERAREGDAPAGHITGHALHYQRTLEGYLKAGNRPRWMERLTDIQRGTADARRRIGDAHERLRAEHAGDPAQFARRWREEAERFTSVFDELNVLIRQHNEWFPIERNLAINPRTRDYVLVNGRSYRREPIDVDWVLRHFPATWSPPSRPRPDGPGSSLR
jgi:hypothetical protein